MKETKMYISNLPKSCSECPCTHEDFAECNWCQVFDNGLLTYIPDEIYTKERLENCPLQTIKDHDRELVKEVCEKIRENIEARNINELDIINRLAVFLDEIEKEFEK